MPTNYLLGQNFGTNYSFRMDIISKLSLYKEEIQAIHPSMYVPIFTAQLSHLTVSLSSSREISRSSYLPNTSCPVTVVTRKGVRVATWTERGTTSGEEGKFHNLCTVMCLESLERWNRLVQNHFISLSCGPTLAHRWQDFSLAQR